MDIDKDNRHYDRDQELQNRDRDKENQELDVKSGKNGSDQDKDEKITGNPERLRDSAHRMDIRTNEVQGEVDYDQDRHPPNEEPHYQTESNWTDIKSDYRKRYPELTEEDLHYKSGEFKHMAARIAKRTNRTPEQVIKEIRDWNRKH